MANTATGAEKGNTRTITFRNKEHEKFFKTYLQKCESQDVYRQALIYCLGSERETILIHTERETYKNTG